MNDNSKCFIRRNDKTYEEITYKELEERRRTIPKYNEKKFIYIHKMLMEVNEEEYQDYYYEIERNRYAEKVLKKLTSMSLDELETIDKLKFVADKNDDIELKVINKLCINKLKSVLTLLDKDEYELIKALFYENISLRKYAAQHSISHNTLYSREKKILEKIKKYMKN